MRLISILYASITVTTAALAACSSGGEGGSGTTSSTTNTGGGDTGTGTGTGGNTGGSAPMMGCTEKTPVACSDEIILKMNLQDTPVAATVKIENTADGSGWSTKVDATAGGAFSPKPTSYTYGKFTDQGLEKVDISDEQSLDSMAWDIAFRRYVVRINSGDSGPSCVQGARVPGSAKFEDVTAIPDGLSYHTDDYFTASCTLIPDGTGLEDSPATALSSYWTYPGCVKMTDHVFVISLADGRHVKLAVDSYYSPTVQEQCDTVETIPMSNTGSANFIVRWAFLQ